MELTPAATLALIACVVLLLYALVWWLTRTISRRARIIARSAVVLVIGAVSGIGLLLTVPLTSQDRMSSVESRPEVESADREQGFPIPDKRARKSDDAAPRPGGPRMRARKSDDASPRPGEPRMRARRSDDAGSRPGGPRMRSRSSEEAARPRGPASREMGAPSRSGETRPSGADRPSAGDAPTTRSGESIPASTPPADSSDWDVVPVFYGTDRAKLPDAEPVDYGSIRGKRLQLGHALVTVPKSHQVPEVERPWVYRIPFTQIVIWEEEEDPKRHFTLKDIREMGSQELLELVRKRLDESEAYENHALVFVHGFNTSFQFAVFRTAQIAYDLKFDGAPFLYSWPSKGGLGVQDYSYDRESAQAAEPYFREFLDLVVRDTGAKSISVIAHSMGNQLLLPVLRDLRRSAPEDVRISQVILAAPDVDRDTFEFMVREIQGISGGITLFAASNDRALAVSRRFWGGVPRAGDVPTEGPIVVPGVDTIDVTAINTEMFSLNHSGYAEKTELLNDIRLLIQTGERPPERRIPILERMDSASGAFWRYPQIR